MIMLGILGEYLWRTFDESRKRPRFIVERKKVDAFLVKQPIKDFVDERTVS